MKQLRILERIFLFLIFGAHRLAFRRDLFSLLLLLPISASSAKWISAGSTPTNLLPECEFCLECGADEIGASLGRCVVNCRLSERAVISLGLTLVRGSCVVGDGGGIVFERVRYGIASRVDEKFPNAKRRGFGVSGVRLSGGPTLERPLNKW